MTDLGTIAGTDKSDAASINSKTQIVGAAFTSDFSVVDAFLWERGSLVDLNSPIPSDTALHLLKGTAINDRGEIAGFGGLPNGDVHAFMLIPCDEDHPNVEGCDYSEFDEASAPELHGAQLPANQQKLTPVVVKDQIRAMMMNRNRRFGPWRP